MKITYTCEICGNTSSDKEKISSCWISIDPKTQKKVGFTYDSGNLVPVGTYSEEEMTLV